MRAIEGVTLDVATAMIAVEANVLCEDGLMQRTCEHGIRHPVGHLSRRIGDPDLRSRHSIKTRWGMEQGGTECCGCCQTWAKP